MTTQQAGKLLSVLGNAGFSRDDILKIISDFVKEPVSRTDDLANIIAHSAGR